MGFGEKGEIRIQDAPRSEADWLMEDRDAFKARRVHDLTTLARLVGHAPICVRGGTTLPPLGRNYVYLVTIAPDLTQDTQPSEGELSGYVDADALERALAYDPYASIASKTDE